MLLRTDPRFFWQKCLSVILYDVFLLLYIIKLYIIKFSGGKKKKGPMILDEFLNKLYPDQLPTNLKSELHCHENVLKQRSTNKVKTPFYSVLLYHDCSWLIQNVFLDTSAAQVYISLHWMHPR